MTIREENEPRSRGPADAFLSREELERLTGYRQPKCQIRWLTENGVRFYIPATGRPAVPRAVIDGGPTGENDGDGPPLELGDVA